MYLRLSVLHLLSLLIDSCPEKVQQMVLSHPMGVNRIADILHDQRDPVRARKMIHGAALSLRRVWCFPAHQEDGRVPFTSTRQCFNTSVHVAYINTSIINSQSSVHVHQHNTLSTTPQIWETGTYPIPARQRGGCGSLAPIHTTHSNPIHTHTHTPKKHTHTANPRVGGGNQR